MDKGIVIKSNVLEILERQLSARAKKKQYGFVAVGSATDAYMRHEEKFKLTEGILQLLLKYRFPVFISTKSTLILRDIELLKEIDKSAILPNNLKKNFNRGAILSVSLSTVERKITDMLEPGASTPQQRLETVQQLKKEGFFVGINAIPILPFISDTDDHLEKMITAAKRHEADYILVGGLTLFGQDAADSKPLYFNFLKRFDPSLLPLYEKLYGINFYPPKKYLEELKSKSEKICIEHNIRTSILNTHVKSIKGDTESAPELF